MNVKCAKDHIEQISKICNEINAFDEKHTELQDEVGFFIKRKEKVKKY